MSYEKDKNTTKCTQLYTILAIFTYNTQGFRYYSYYTTPTTTENPHKTTTNDNATNTYFADNTSHGLLKSS